MNETVARGAILSLNLNHDSSAALFLNGQLVAAVCEERLNRMKFTRAFPERSISEVLRIGGISGKDVSVVLLGSKISPNLVNFFVSEYHKKASEDVFHWLLPMVMLEQSLFRQTGLIDGEGNLIRLIVKKRLSGLSITAPIQLHEHHLSHCYSGYGSSGFDDALVVSMDSMGDGLSTMVGIGREGVVTPVERANGFASIGYIYSQVTQLLGFIPGRHEGKLTGLAAYGQPSKTEGQFRQIMDYIEGQMRVKRIWSCGHPLYQQIMNNDREDVAAGLQYVFEDVISKFIADRLKKYQKNRIALAGGVFANVKLNQRIYEKCNVERIFIFPNMGDGGLSVGAGYAYLRKRPETLKSVYWGADFPSEIIEKCLGKAGLAWEKVENVERRIASLIAAGKVVGRFAGRAEFGPRALGNRSILCKADDKAINTWLNKKMKRTEFMPFAPATLEEYADEYYSNIGGARDAARFMTITFNCTQKSRELQNACVHLDNTARPQLVNKEDNPSFHAIIEHFRELTSTASIINTSFNVHEEPIVNTPNDAIKSFLECELDVLAIENYIVMNPRQ